MSRFDSDVQRGEPGYHGDRAEFCIASDTTYSLTGTLQASASEDLDNTAAAEVSIETVGATPMFIVSEQASDGETVPLSMSLPCRRDATT